MSKKARRKQNRNLKVTNKKLAKKTIISLKKLRKV